MRDNQEEIKKLSNRIIASPGFKNSEQYILLLQFLIKSYLNNDHVKEAILELELSEIFGKHSSYSAKVRVYMYNLRKKLDEYYRTDGINDKLVFKIVKGQYNLSIDKNLHTPKANISFSFKAFATIIALLLVSISWLFIRIKPPKNCWVDFMQKNSASVCYIGDHYTVWGKIDGKEYASVHFENVNSESEFDQLVYEKILNDSKFEKDNYSFVTKMGPISASRLTYWFVGYKKDLEVRMESEFNSISLVDENIIFIGPQKTLNGLKTLFLRNSKVFEFNGWNIINTESQLELKDTLINNIAIDHVMVSYNKISDNGKKIIFFASNNDIGVMAAVSNFTNKEWLKEFYTKLPSHSSYFNALFQVRGLNRTNIECELLKLELLD